MEWGSAHKVVVVVCIITLVLLAFHVEFFDKIGDLFEWCKNKCSTGTDRAVCTTSNPDSTFDCDPYYHCVDKCTA